MLATDLPDGRNIADDYLCRRGWKESVSTREYIAGLRRAVISLYEVSRLVPDESMLLRDLLRGGEAVRGSEKSGSQGLRPMGQIATRIIPLRDRTVVSGALLAFDRDSREVLLASLGRVRSEAPRDVAVVARELGIETDAERLAGILTPAKPPGLLAERVLFVTADEATDLIEVSLRPVT